MKLAEALNLRADIAKRIAQLGSRLQNNALVQEGEQPAENPKSLLTELNELIIQQEELIGKINLTNAKTVSEGKTLTEMIAHKDCVRDKISIMRAFLDAASRTVSRGLRSEIKILSTVNVAELRKQVDALEKDFRETDVKIQSLNWSTELI
ncbi:MAG: DIP1984 family protein [Oscillospiraceae bacterium]|nr:DIP1984 family protein [Oscillospiraceae bacterium]